MAKLKSERHHWWPECVSDFWKDTNGCVTRLTPDDEAVPAPPKNWGVIQNGHLVKLARDPSEYCPWDENFEDEFRNADANFPHLISWLAGVFSEDRRDAPSLRDRFVPEEINETRFRNLIECLVSLAVRSPRTRQHAVALAEHYRGPLPERERNGLIGANLRHFQRNVMQSVDGRGKIAVLYSPDCEFIFGDGFYHSLMAPPNPPLSPTIVAPLTPAMTAIYSKPMAYGVEPRFTTMIVTPEEVTALNDTVQIYSAKMIFYRDERPTLIDSFKLGQHHVYASNDNPVDYLVHSIPGIQDRDRDMERWLDRLAASG